MSASPVIVREVRGEEASQVPLAENDDVIQAFAPDRADESLGEGILPRAVRGRENFTDTDTCPSPKPGRLARWTSVLVGQARDEGD